MANKQQPSSSPLHCHFCKAPNASHWFRKPGFFSELAQADRRYLRACCECLGRAIDRHTEKFAPKRLLSPPSHPAPQADLFG